MITVFLWEWLTHAQQAETAKYCSYPPSGEDSVMWVNNQGEWSFKTYLTLADLRAGVQIGKPGMNLKRLRKREAISAMHCEHANEVPFMCPCPGNCYCKSHTCKFKKRG